MSTKYEDLKKVKWHNFSWTTSDLRFMSKSWNLKVCAKITYPDYIINWSSIFHLSESACKDFSKKQRGYRLLNSEYAFLYLMNCGLSHVHTGLYLYSTFPSHPPLLVMEGSDDMCSITTVKSQFLMLFIEIEVQWLKELMKIQQGESALKPGLWGKINIFSLRTESLKEEWHLLCSAAHLHLQWRRNLQSVADSYHRFQDSCLLCEFGQCFLAFLRVTQIE